ncbi:hypothetical protein O3P69_002725 [Scylla paramamosain]|uniref:Uncharacterized protein n=1 Tax=Scylla paramamosain TaxID=85552 RepID=A0AAW0UNE5_SCYPA
MTCSWYSVSVVVAALASGEGGGGCGGSDKEAMRTAGIRSVPQPAPRPTLFPDAPDTPQPPQPPKPLPRTKFLQKSVSESPAPVTLRSPPAPPVQSKCISTKTPTPPPKPPRTPSLRNSPNKDSTQPRRPGLMEVLSRTNTASPISPASITQRQPTSTLKPVRPAPQGRAADFTAVSARRNQRPSLQPLSLPSPPSGIPARIPSSSAGPRVPTRPSPGQLAASRTLARASDLRSAPPLTVGLQTNRSLQSPVCTIEDFEDSCKEVFRNTKKAKELSARGKHIQATSHFQKALTALDRVLRAQVLSLSQHEPTRQRLFLLQQEVFSLRKETLNGFTDAQTAVRTPPGLAPTPATPGAPPSYDDVLKEDSRRLQDNCPHPPREISTQGTVSSPNHPTPTGQGFHPCTHPVPTQSPANHTPSACVRSHSSGDPGVQELVDMRGARSGEPTTAPPSTHQCSPFKSTLKSTKRPKSSYHPLSQPNSLLLPSPAVSSPASLPPPLLPVSHSLASLPTQQSGATSLETQPYPSLRPISVGDEAVLSQMKVLDKYKSDRSPDALADTSLSCVQKGPLPPIPLNKDNMQEWKRKEEITSNDSVQALSKSIVKTSGSTVQQKDETKNNLVPFISPINDPFLSLDPFPPVKPQSEDSNALFTEETLGAHSLPAVSGMHQNHSQASSDVLAPESSWTSNQKDSFSSNATQDSLKTQPLMTQNPPDNLGDSILEALDFAVTPASDHRKVSPQHSQERKTTRSYSEENLLNSSYNTFEIMLLSTKNRQASRASIIEEFDPLVIFHAPQDHTQDEEKMEDEVHEQKGKGVLKEKKRDTKSTVPTKPTPRTTVETSDVSSKGTEATKEEGERDIYGSPPDYFAEGGAVALEEEARVDMYTSRRYTGAYDLSDRAKGRSYSSSEDTSSMYSWPPDYSAKTPPDPASPVYPCLYPEEEENEGVEGTNVGVGRSAFYIPPTIQGEVKRRNLLSIREGVKIYFIHTDGIVTSPWNKPFLAVSRDLSRDKFFSTGLVVSVGNNLWTCELQRKSTLVLRAQTGSYIFNEVAGKPECKAVAIRVPSGVRRVQHELFSNILQQNTLLEEERPKGITKAISKGATSAATRMTKLVEDKSVTPSQTFVRRNSIRALKGVTKRLTSIAEKTGGTLKELPEEYQVLQEAADTLAFAHSAKMIQYV